MGRLEDGEIDWKLERLKWGISKENNVRILDGKMRRLQDREFGHCGWRSRD
jgi:hypothetical protein